MPASELKFLLGSAGLEALCSGHWTIMPIHLLAVACRMASARILLRSQGIDPERVYAESLCAIDAVPRDATPPLATFVGRELLKVIDRANAFGGQEAKHIILALVDDECDAAGFLLKHHFQFDPRRAVATAAEGEPCKAKT